MPIMLLQLVRTNSSFFFFCFFYFGAWLSVILFFFFIFLSSVVETFKKSRVVWVGAEPALLASYYLTLGGGALVIDERRTKTADRVAT